MSMSTDDGSMRLRDASQRDDGQVLPPSIALDAQLQLSAGPSTDERLLARAHGSSRPSRALFEARLAARGEPPEVDLVGRAALQARMRTLGVVPSDVVVELAPEGALRQRHNRQQACALGLQRLDEALDDGEAAVLADGAEALGDAVAAAPRRELAGDELRPVKCATDLSSRKTLDLAESKLVDLGRRPSTDLDLPVNF